MISTLLGQLPRFVSLAFTGYAVFLVSVRWPVTRVLTRDRRFLLLFFLLELLSTATNTTMRIVAGDPTTIGAWLALLTQAFLTAYLHYSIPAPYRRFWYRVTRRPGRLRPHG